MKNIIKIFIPFALNLFFITACFAQDTSSSKPVDMDSFIIGDTCTVNLSSGEEISGIIMNKSTGSIEISGNQLHYTIPVDKIVSIKHTGQKENQVPAVSSKIISRAFNYSVCMKNNSKYRCNLESITGDSLQVNDRKFGTTFLQADEIKTVTKIQRTRASEGYFLGGTVGFVTGFFASYSYAHKYYESGEKTDEIHGDMILLGGSIIGTVSGVLIGGLIGSFFGGNDVYTLDKMDKQEKIRELRKIIPEK